MIIWLIIIVGVIFLDQLSKYLTIINLDYIAPPSAPDTIPVIKDVFHFTYVRNTGAAFSMFNEPDERWIFMSISTVAIIALAIYLWLSRKGNKLLCVALCFIIGGGIGNMIDRCVYKYVIDMLDFRLINFAIFNVADSFVCIGVGLFALAVIIEEIKNSKDEKAKKVEENAKNDNQID